jgi:hypothetical protein
MNCGEAAEFVSTFCDGETIPRAAAEHIGECKACHAQLREYAEIGAELRRVASLRPMEASYSYRCQPLDLSGESGRGVFQEVVGS